jgi:hypothetical protein
VAAVVLVALVVGGVWVRVADPVALRGSPPAVDASDPPAEVIADSVERLRYVDYTFRLSPSRVTSQVTKVENTDRERYTSIGTVRKRYVAEGGLWLKFRGEGWRSVESTGFSRELATPFRPEPLRSADATVLSNESGTLVVAVNDSAAVSAALNQTVKDGRLLLYVDLDSGRLRQVRLRSTLGDGSRWWTYTFYNYRKTSVERPSGVPDRTAWDLLRDALRG